MMAIVWTRILHTTTGMLTAKGFRIAILGMKLLLLSGVSELAASNLGTPWAWCVFVDTSIPTQKFLRHRNYLVRLESEFPL
jgi:hypothetical protein